MPKLAAAAIATTAGAASHDGDRPWRAGARYPGDRVMKRRSGRSGSRPRGRAFWRYDSCPGLRHFFAGAEVGAWARHVNQGTADNNCARFTKVSDQPDRLVLAPDTLV